ncbi:MAG TPA: hypothetical protein VID24_06190 [Candidatus Eremiobacteraceae bacterium]|jgi:hypothetical protein
MLKKTIAFAVIAAACLAAACTQQETRETPVYTGGSVPPLVPASHEEMVKVAGRAPHLGSASFGPGVVVTMFKPTWGLTDARVVGDVIYLLYTPTPQQTTKRLGVLRGGTLYPVFFPVEYADMAFVDNDTGLIAVRANKLRDVYALKNGQAILTNKTSEQTFLSPEKHTLEDGGSCSDPGSENSALDEVRAGHRTTLLTSDQLMHASFGIVDIAADATCDHFNGKSYAAFGAPSVVFELAGDRTKAVTAGWIDIASERHIVFERLDGTFVEADVR